MYTYDPFEDELKLPLPNSSRVLDPDRIYLVFITLLFAQLANSLLYSTYF